jgi:hypothetical protein
MLNLRWTMIFGKHLANKSQRSSGTTIQKKGSVIKMSMVFGIIFLVVCITVRTLRERGSLAV